MPDSLNAGLILELVSRGSRGRPTRQRQEVLKLRSDEVWIDDVNTLWKTKRTGVDRVRFWGNFNDETTRTHSARSCKNSGVNNTVPTHIMLLSRDSATKSPSVSRSCRFYNQHVQMTRRHSFHCHPDVGLLLSLVRLVVCWDCHVTSFARSTWVVCSGDKLNMNAKLNGYTSQRNVSRLEINEY